MTAIVKSLILGYRKKLILETKLSPTVALPNTWLLK